MLLFCHWLPSSLKFVSLISDCEELNSNITSCDKDADFVKQIALLLILLCGVISLGFLVLCFGIVQIAQSKSSSGSVTSDIFTFIFLYINIKIIGFKLYAF